MLEQITKNIVRTNNTKLSETRANKEVVLGRPYVKPRNALEESSFKSVRLGHLQFKSNPVMSKDNGVLLSSGEIGIITKIKAK